MRLRPEALLLILATLSLWVVAHSRPIAAQSQNTDTGPGSAVVARALETVKADPNLAAERKTRLLRWRDSGAQTSETPAWMRLLADFAIWIAESGRLLIWLAAIGAAVLLAVYLIRVSRPHTGQEAEDLSHMTPTHVRELDIRPESLPHDIGAAARALWEQGDRPAAVSLLYRGLLSRLVHRYRVPIRDSSTEGDCLNLVRVSAPPRPADYASELVQVWQRFVYGHVAPADDNVLRLCAEFDASLGGESTRPPARPAGAA